MIIAVVVLLSVMLNFAQSVRSQRAADGLHAQVTIAATALRDGTSLPTPSRVLVPGDSIRLSEPE